MLRLAGTIYVMGELSRPAFVVTPSGEGVGIVAWHDGGNGFIVRTAGYSKDGVLHTQERVPSGSVSVTEVRLKTGRYLLAIEPMSFGSGAKGQAALDLALTASRADGASYLGVTGVLSLRPAEKEQVQDLKTMRTWGALKVLYR